MGKILKALTFICIAFASWSCVYESDSPKNETNRFNEAEKCDEYVTAKVYGYGSISGRASSTFLEENIDRFTATRVDTKNNKFTLVSYHGRNKENIGMVQLIDAKTGEVYSEIVFSDARVNFAQYRESNGNETAYIGLDRNGSGDVLCGLLCVAIRDKKFVIESNELYPYKVDGMSINCIKQHNGDTEVIGNSIIVVASGGNSNSPAAGFTKFRINTANPLELGLLSKVVEDNFRGYWFSYGYLNGAPYIKF